MRIKADDLIVRTFALTCWYCTVPPPDVLYCTSSLYAGRMMLLPDALTSDFTCCSILLQQQLIALSIFDRTNQS